VPSRESPAEGAADFPDLDSEQVLSDRDQTSADSDQTLSDGDQTASDRDQGASERDQLAADRDQRSSDRDHAGRDPDEDDPAYDKSRMGRAQSARERDLSAEARSESARMRDLAAERRDAVANARDKAADERDRLASKLDERAERDAHPPEGNGARDRAFGLDLLMRAAADRERAAELRGRVRAQREAASRDREQAARDRRRAALDRQAAADELASEGVDHLTGSLRRRPGMAAIQREMDRTARTSEPMVIAFVDVDGLKAVNDAQGHQAGDKLLLSVASCIKHDLRSYDLIVRYGGDEFVCSMSGQPAAAVAKRFELISDDLAEKATGATFSVGVTERELGDALEDLLGRADATMIAARKVPPRV
jgi:diguanylate cyclase (GGDEF)-like protein